MTPAEPILRAALPLYATLIPLILIIYVRTSARTDEAGESSRLFFQVLVVVFVGSVIDTMAWLPDGIDTPTARFLNRTFNTLYYALSTIGPLVWVRYFDFLIVEDTEGLRRRTWLYAIPTFLGWVLLVVNAFTGLIFTVSVDNVYARGPINIVFLLLNYVLLVYGLFAAIRFWKRIRGRVTVVLMSFIVLPILGSTLQQLFFGISLIYPMIDLVALLAFLYIEKDGMLKDSLTGLSTRRQFENHMHAIMRRDQAFSLILIDLNDFKTINDTWGHEAGDRALVTTASILTRQTKREDMVCRYGGDEFVVLVASGNPDAAGILSSRLLQATEDFNARTEEAWQIGMSIGAMFVDKATDPDTLLSELDARMYEDKRARKKA